MKIIPGLFLLLALCGCGRKETVSYEQILGGLLDTGRMADLAQPGARLFSSWDRTGENNDFGNFLGDGPDGWKILADVKGSGYISRSWFTGSKDGSKRIRFYIDNARTPAYETDMDHWCGPWNDYSTLPLRGYEPYCWFSWIPLSFSKRLIVTEQPPAHDEKIYYQININQLPKGYKAEKWTPSMLADPALLAMQEQINTRWTEFQETDTSGPFDQLVAAANAETPLWQQNTPGTIKQIRIRPDWPESFNVNAREDALRSLVVRLYWDDQDKPSVDVPLGALCGSMWHEMQYGAIYFGMSDDVYRLSFPMPFRKQARLAILNQTRTDIPLGLAVEADALPPAETAGYFHAGWRKSLASQVGSPHTVLNTEGRGKYVGCILGVISLDNSWWALESDEHFYVDGEAEARWRGTGLEDYFNGGWYYGNALAAPLHGIPFKAPYRTIQYRLHLADPVNFEQSLRMIFERGPKHISQAEMESVSFYYLEQPAGADSSLRDPAFRQPAPDPVRPYTLMTEVNNFERLGDVSGAIARLQAYREDFPDTPFNEVIENRIARYADPHPIPENHAVLGVYANTQVRVFLNGRLVADINDEHADRVHFQTIPLEPGTHTFAIHYARRPYPDWVQLMLEYPGGFLGTDNTWKYAFDPTDRWTSPFLDDSSWDVHDYIWAKGPPEDPYVWNQPHDRPFTQSRAWALRAPAAGWPANARAMVLRKTFTIPGN